MSILAKISAALGGSRGEEEFSAIQLIPAAQNPFGIEIWDCRAFTHNRVSTTANPEIAHKYVQLRSSHGDDYQGQTPANAQLVSCHLTYPLSPKPSNGPLFKSEQMEDKWDVYLFDDTLYFARSWTGELTFKAKVRYEPRALLVTELAVEGNDDAAFAPRVVDYLIKSHLLRREVPHPLPQSLPPTPKHIALYSFAMFGRRCSFGTYGDTITRQPSGSSH